MRITSVAQVRNDLLQLITDYLFSPIKGRTYSNESLLFSSSLVGGTTTTVKTYTVPANKIAVVSSACVSVYCYTAPTTAGLASHYIEVVLSGGTNNWLIRSAQHVQNVGDKDFIAISPNLILAVGDEIRIKTNNGTSGGGLVFSSSIIINEYDV